MTNQQSNQQINQHKASCAQLVITLVAVTATLSFIPEAAFANTSPPSTDAFATIFTKVNSWVGGSAGKLITFISIVMAGIMGVMSFPARYIVGALGTGLLLSSASALVDMIF